MKNIDAALTPESQPSLLASAYVRDVLHNTAKWTKFLGIVGFVLTGVVVLASVILMAFSTFIDEFGLFEDFGSLVFGFLYLIGGILYFFPSLYLFQYSQKLSATIHSQDENLLVQALEKNKSFFQFVGVLMAIMVGLYVVGIMFGVGVAGSLSGW